MRVPTAAPWLLRIEDIDAQRTVAGADRVIMRQLQTLGLRWDGEVLWQSQRDAVYRQAMDDLAARGLVYGCACTRREIIENHTALEQARGKRQALLDGERPYAGTCRQGLPPGRQARAWRLRVPPGEESFTDRWLGPQRPERGAGRGRFRAAASGRHVGVSTGRRRGRRGAGRDRYRAGRRPTQFDGTPAGAGAPAGRAARLRHARPLILDPATGLKLSKQNHAPALDLARPVAQLGLAWRALGFRAYRRPIPRPASWPRAAISRNGRAASGRKG